MKNKWLAMPHLLWMAIFTIIPLFLVLYYALTTSVPSGQGSDAVVFSLDNFAKAFQPQYLGVIIKSLSLAVQCTLICLLLGYPVGYILASREYEHKSVLLFLFVVPMWMNFLLRTYAWLTILENNGVINSVLDFFGFKKMTLLYTDSAVLLGMVYNYLPFMILPIYTILKKMDFSLIEAAQDLGADPLRVFLRVVFPLSVPGIVSGITMVFMPAVSTFVISNLLGGGHSPLIGNLIEKQFLTAYDWNFGSALSMLLMIVILISMAFVSKVDKDSEGGALL